MITSPASDVFLQFPQRHHSQPGVQSIVDDRDAEGFLHQLRVQSQRDVRAAGKDDARSRRVFQQLHLEQAAGEIMLRVGLYPQEDQSDHGDLPAGTPGSG